MAQLEKSVGEGVQMFNDDICINLLRGYFLRLLTEV
jgi:hypothetical protein